LFQDIVGLTPNGGPEIDNRSIAMLVNLHFCLRGELRRNDSEEM
jgi:hypothetical protein